MLTVKKQKYMWKECRYEEMGYVGENKRWLC